MPQEAKVGTVDVINYIIIIFKNPAVRKIHKIHILLKYVFVLQKKNILNQSVYFFVNSFKTMAFLIQFTFLACNTKSILNFEYTTATRDVLLSLRSWMQSRQRGTDRLRNAVVSYGQILSDSYTNPHNFRQNSQVMFE